MRPSRQIGMLEGCHGFENQSREGVSRHINTNVPQEPSAHRYTDHTRVMQTCKVNKFDKNSLSEKTLHNPLFQHRERHSEIERRHSAHTISHGYAFESSDRGSTKHRCRSRLFSLRASLLRAAVCVINLARHRTTHRSIER